MAKAKFATLINSFRGLCCCSLGNEDEPDSHYERKREEGSAARKNDTYVFVEQADHGIINDGVVPESLNFPNVKDDNLLCLRVDIPSDNIVNTKPVIPIIKKQLSKQDIRNHNDIGAVKKNIQHENISFMDTKNRHTKSISNVNTDLSKKQVRKTNNRSREINLSKNKKRKVLKSAYLNLEDMPYDAWNTKKRECGKMVNIYKSNDNNVQIFSNGSPYPPSASFKSRTNVEANTYWYHGTNYESAVSILKQINLRKGNVKQDFSHKDGFYLSPDFKGAKHIAFGKKTKGIPAVLIFKRNFNLQMYSGLKLQSKSEWEAIIKYNRSGKNSDLCDPSQQLLDKFSESDYIFGPINTDGPCPTVKGIQNFRTWKINGYKMKYRQLCIRGKKLASVFGNDIESVIVYPNK